MRIVCHYSVRIDLNKPSHSILIVDSPIVDRNVSLMSVFNEITVDEIAKKHGTINYEIICGINKRVPRVYTGEGRIVAIADYMK